MTRLDVVGVAVVLEPRRALTLSFALLAFGLIDRGEKLRFYATEAVAYTIVCAVVLSLTKVVFGRGPLFAGFPAPLIVGMWTVFAGGHALAVGAHLIRLRVQHVPPPPHVVLERDPTPDELRTAAAYEQRWLRDDRQRTRRWRAERRRRGWGDEIS